MGLFVSISLSCLGSFHFSSVSPSPTSHHINTLSFLISTHFKDSIQKHIHPATTMTKDTSKTPAEPQPTEAAPESPYYGMYGHYWKSNRDVPPTKWL